MGFIEQRKLFIENSKINTDSIHNSYWDQRTIDNFTMTKNDFIEQKKYGIRSTYSCYKCLINE